MEKTTSDKQWQDCCYEKVNWWLAPFTSCLLSSELNTEPWMHQLFHFLCFFLGSSLDWQQWGEVRGQMFVTVEFHTGSPDVPVAEGHKTMNGLHMWRNVHEVQQDPGPTLMMSSWCLLFTLSLSDEPLGRARCWWGWKFWWNEHVCHHDDDDNAWATTPTTGPDPVLSTWSWDRDAGT